MHACIIPIIVLVYVYNNNIYIGNDESCDLLLRTVISLVVVAVVIFIIALILAIYLYILRKKLSLSRELESNSEPTFSGKMNRFEYTLHEHY